MDSVARGAAVYLLLLLIFRLAGRRTLAQMTSFDFVLLLIISEAAQNAMIGDDYSVTNGALVVLTLVGLDVLLSQVKRWWPMAERWLDGKPTIIVEHGRPKIDIMNNARVDERDVLAAARETQGLERMDQIKFAVLETSGGISIIPR
ncbi:MAG TPA: YetF domain-containing protein [Nitrospira sp.]|nr:YetF domain-containing protein [Nitrospira sp.]